MKNKELAFYLEKNTSQNLLEKVYQSEYTHIFLEWANRDLINKIHAPGKFKFGFCINTLTEANEFSQSTEYHSSCNYIFLIDDEFAAPIIKSGFNPGYFIHVSNQVDLNRARKLCTHASSLLIDFKDPTNIPLELLIAENQDTECRLFKIVNSSIDGKLSLQTMETGSHGVTLRTNDIEEIIAMNQFFSEHQKTQLNFSTATVTRIIHAGMGDRVCVDTTSVLTQDEGMILGSTSSGGLVLCSETHFLPYMDLRPFRVNAGGLHMYTWGPDKKAYYLSDLKAGDIIWVVNSKGEARTVTIGRIKRERRPLLLIEAKIMETLVNVFIQDDWHVRVMGSGGEIRPSREIQIGDTLLGFSDSPGRHVGIKINENISEV